NGLIQVESSQWDDFVGSIQSQKMEGGAFEPIISHHVPGVVLQDEDRDLIPRSVREITCANEPRSFSRRRSHSCRLVDWLRSEVGRRFAQPGVLTAWPELPNARKR